jgi:hypothetical protein
MNAYPASLEIQVHLSDGSITGFVLCEPETIQQTLDHIRPDRVFTQRQIILATDHALTVYPCSAVARVDLVMEGFPDWPPFPRNVSDIVEISPREFRERFASRIRRVNLDGSSRVFGELELTNGQRLFREVHLKPPPPNAEREFLPQDYTLFLHQLLSAPVLHCRRRGGGAILVNPEHLVRMTFYPGPVNTPANAWRVHAAVDRSLYALPGA